MKSYESRNIYKQIGTGDSIKTKQISIIQSFLVTFARVNSKYDDVIGDSIQHTTYKLAWVSNNGRELSFFRFGDERCQRKMVRLGQKHIDN